MHGVDKGIDPSVQPEKQVIKPIIASEVKGTTQNKPRLGQGRAGIKRKIKPHIPPQLNKPIQSTQESVLQQPQNTTQPIITSIVSLPENSRPHDKCILIPQTRSRDDSRSKMVNRENIFDISRETMPYADPIHGPLLDQKKYHYKKFQGN